MTAEVRNRKFELRAVAQLKTGDFVWGDWTSPWWPLTTPLLVNGNVSPFARLWECDASDNAKLVFYPTDAAITKYELVKSPLALQMYAAL